MERLIDLTGVTVLDLRVMLNEIGADREQNPIVHDAPDSFGKSMLEIELEANKELEPPIEKTIEELNEPTDERPDGGPSGFFES